ERLEADVHERPGGAGRPAHAPATARPIQVSVAVASSGPIARIWKGRLTYTTDQAKVPRNIATGRMRGPVSLSAVSRETPQSSGHRCADRRKSPHGTQPRVESDRHTAALLRPLWAGRARR